MFTVYIPQIIPDLWNSKNPNNKTWQLHSENINNNRMINHVHVKMPGEKLPNIQQEEKED